MCRVDGGACFDGLGSLVLNAHSMHSKVLLRLTAILVQCVAHKVAKGGHMHFGTFVFCTDALLPAFLLVFFPAASENLSNP